MKSIESRPNNINVAIVAHPAAPPGPTGGAEMFSGILADSLFGKGPFKIKVYGHNNPTYKFNPDVEYVESGPHAQVIKNTDKVSDRRATTEAVTTIPLRLARELSEALTKKNGEKWVVIDNDITTASLAPFLAVNRIPHLFINHSFMEESLAGIYRQLKELGGKVVAIADYQRSEVERKFGQIHEVTIKNGVPLNGSINLQSRPSPDSGIQIGTLSRIDADDKKGVRFACEATKRLREQGHPATLSIAGAVNDRTYFDQVIMPHIREGLARYVGLLGPTEKTPYLGNLHVGVALSNRGGWNENAQNFTGEFKEGYSLVLPEMMLYGVLPVSTDSGGAEALVDAKLDDYIVPLSVIEREGRDAFLDLAAKKMLEAAYTPLSREEIQKRARTADKMGQEYAEYILTLLSGRETNTHYSTPMSVP